MTEKEAWQVSAGAAEVYEAKFVPAIFAEWGPRTADGARVAAGDRVLDVACGTGVVARECVRRGARVTGVDLNEGMLKVARRLAPDIDYVSGDAASLPFNDEAFDVVACQFALMFFPEPVRAVAEMARVLRPGGRIGLSTWSVIEKTPVYVVLRDLLSRHLDEAAGAVMQAPFTFGDEGRLNEIFAEAGLTGVEFKTDTGAMKFESVADLVATEVRGSPLAERFDDAALAALTADAEREMAGLESDGPGFVFPASAIVVSARKPDA